MKVQVNAEAVRHLGLDLAEATTQHKAALAAHADTVGVPAPVAHPLVEYIIAQGGEFELVEPPSIPTPAEGVQS